MADKPSKYWKPVPNRNLQALGIKPPGRLSTRIAAIYRCQNVGPNMRACHYYKSGCSPVNAPQCYLKTDYLKRTDGGGKARSAWQSIGTRFKTKASGQPIPGGKRSKQQMDRAKNLTKMQRMIINMANTKQGAQFNSPPAPEFWRKARKEHAMGGARKEDPVVL